MTCQFGLPRVPVGKCCQFMYLVISLLVLTAGCGIGLYQFLIIAYRFTLKKTTSRTMADQAKDKSSSPNPPVKALQRGHHRARGPNHRRAIKELSTSAKRYRANNRARRVPHYTWCILFFNNSQQAPETAAQNQTSPQPLQPRKPSHHRTLALTSPRRRSPLKLNSHPSTNQPRRRQNPENAPRSPRQRQHIDFDWRNVIYRDKDVNKTKSYMPSINVILIERCVNK